MRYMAREEEKRDKKYSDWTLFKKILGIFSYYKTEAISVLAVVVLFSLFTTTLPILMQQIIDYFIKPYTDASSLEFILSGFRNTYVSNYNASNIGILTKSISITIPTSKNEITNSLLIVGAMYLLFIFVNFILILVRTIFFAKLGQKMIYRIRSDLFTKLQYLSFDYFTDTESGRTISKLTNDVDALGELLTTGIIDIFADFISLVWILVLMFILDINMTLLAITVIPLLIMIAFFFQKRVRSAYRRTRVAIAQVTSNLQETISGVKVTKALSREEKNIQNFRDLNKENYSANVQAAGVSSLFMPIIQLIAALGSTIVIIFGGYSVISLGTLTYGKLYAFLEYSNRFFMPVISLFTFYTIIQSGFASAERIFEILDEDPSVKNSAKPFFPKKIKGLIEQESVHFRYQPKVPVLKNITLTIEPGKSIALVGQTGAGKTTITKLLSRYYDVTEGELSIDGINIKEIDLETLRRNIAVVPQDVYLFSGSIKENLKFGRKDATDDEIYDVCLTLGLHDYILKLPEGYDTDVKEGGSRLSLGQRQLISLARAVIANPSILILDECSSSVDPITESLIQKGINLMLRERTSIIIAHRLSTIKTASQIVVIDDGEIVEIGSHEELLKKKGKYRDLYQTQLTSNLVK
ncbi:MAG: ABC transporter ATP-binding protein [Candidatus Heimdallarchaeota archaeon]|nr:ABC transporter ATP-binding protein [Candidatus Heimdallarchaeota archaeon]MCK5142496.1 ABC transporter ATP-binding protein [Candidatus Heimdallarchaeota archaeon]